MLETLKTTIAYPVNAGGSIRFVYPSGRNASSYQKHGEILVLSDGTILRDASDAISVSYDEIGVTVAYGPGPTIPAGPIALKIPLVPELEDIAPASVTASKSSVAAAIRNGAIAGRARNPFDLGDISSPPTVTLGSDNTSGLTKQYRPNTTPGVFTTYGGQPRLNQYNEWQFPALHETGGNVSGTNPAQSAIYWSVEFWHDGTSLDIITEAGGSLKCGIAVNDQYIATAGTSTNITNEAVNNLAFGSRAVRKIRVDFDGAMSFIGVNVGPTESIWNTGRSPKKVAVFSDSFGTGTGASRAALAWSACAGQLLGGYFDFQSCSIGGCGYIEAGGGAKIRDHLVADLTQTTYDAIVFASGINDRPYTTAAIQAEALACFRLARATCPNAPIIVLGPWAGSTGPDATIIAVENAIAAAVTAFGDALTTFVPVCTATQPWIYGTGRVSSPAGSGNSDVYTGGTSGSDSTHPNTSGHLHIARRFVAALEEKVVPILM